MALTDTAIRKTKPTEKPFKLADSSGLYLLIKPNGSKLWYMNCQSAEKSFVIQRLFAIKDKAR